MGKAGKPESMGHFWPRTLMPQYQKYRITLGEVVKELLRYQVLANESGLLLETFSKVGDAASKAVSTPFNMQVG